MPQDGDALSDKGKTSVTGGIVTLPPHLEINKENVEILKLQGNACR